MLSIIDRGYARNCQGTSRREFLQVGSLSLLGGLALPDLLRARSELASAGLPVRDKSVVLLFLQGGPPHIEFFDPKMTAPAEIRCMNGEVKTTLPGITFGASFSKMAKLTGQLAVVRSYASGNAGHTYLEVTSGGNPMKASMSALYAKLAGTTRPTTGMPTNVLVLPEAVQPGLKLGGNFETGALPTLTSPGELGTTFAAFNPSNGGELQKNMKLKLPAERFDDRRKLLAKLDVLKRDIDTSGTMDGADKFQQQAFDVVTRGVAKAFDLSKEDPKTIDRYDTSKLFKAASTFRSGTT